MENKYVNIPMKHIYVVANEHEAVKIGVSQDVNGRINVLSRQGGFKVKELYKTEKCSNSYNLERKIHKQLNNYRINSEWFIIPFDEAVKIVTDIFKINARFEMKKQRCITPEDIERIFNMK